MRELPLRNNKMLNKIFRKYTQKEQPPLVFVSDKEELEQYAGADYDLISTIFRRLEENNDFVFYKSFLLNNIQVVSEILLSGKKDGKFLTKERTLHLQGQYVGLSFAYNALKDVIDTYEKQKQAEVEQV